MWFKNECNRTSERLWEYASQRLTASETAQIETHLQQCTRCRAEADAYRQTVGMLGAARQMPVPASQTTWRDLRPSLAPSRRPVLRSADFLPRLTLAGASAALGATLLVVFFSGAHHATLTGNPPSRSSETVAPEPTNSPAGTDVAIKDNDDRSETDNRFTGSPFGPIIPSVIALPKTTETARAEVPNSVHAPKAPAVRRRRYSYDRHLASNGVHPNSVAPSADPEASDGKDVASRSPRDYVMGLVSPPPDDAPARRYVNSHISLASNDGADEVSE